MDGSASGSGIRRRVVCALVIAACFFCSACTLFERSASCSARKLIAPDVLKLTSENDTPNFCRYHETLAALYVPYAIMSLNAYQPRDLPAGVDPLKVQSCQDDTYKVRCPAGWSFDPDPGAHPPAGIKKAAGGLFMEAFFRTTRDLALSETVEYVIAFRGTEPSDWQDWRANLRWFLPFLRRTDQYPEGRKTAVEWAARACRLARAKGLPLRIITTGHSLGGGLAQGAAYAILRALPPEMTSEQLAGTSNPSEEERASRRLLADECTEVHGHVRVVAVVFDPSPVTGYGDGQAVRDCENPRSNACRLPVVMRVYESGEILAYFRRVLGWFYPVALNVCEDRFDFGPGLPVDQHQMRRIATGLIRTGKQNGKEDISAIFEHHCPASTTKGALVCDTPASPACPL